MEPVHALEWRDGIALGCQDHCNDTGSKGIIGHTGSDDSTNKIRSQRYGSLGSKLKSGSAENISYGYKTPESIIM